MADDNKVDDLTNGAFVAQQAALGLPGATFYGPAEPVTIYAAPDAPPWTLPRPIQPGRQPYQPQTITPEEARESLRRLMKPTMEQRVNRLERQVEVLKRLLEGRVITPPPTAADLEALGPSLPAPPAEKMSDFRVAPRGPATGRAPVFIPATDREAMLWDAIKVVAQTVDALNDRGVSAWVSEAEEAKRSGATTMTLPDPYFWSFKPTGFGDPKAPLFVVWQGILAPRYIMEGTADKIERLLQNTEP